MSLKCHVLVENLVSKYSIFYLYNCEARLILKVIFQTKIVDGKLLYHINYILKWLLKQCFVTLSIINIDFKQSINY